VPILGPVIDGALRVIAIAASAVIVLSFLLFAIEQGADASKAQQSAIVDPGAGQERVRAEGHTAVRELIDDANDELLRPFAGVVDSGNQWERRLVPALLGLLVYGLGLGFLARLLTARSNRLDPLHHRSTREQGAGGGTSKAPPA
jgi:hypothetical protein